MVYTVTRSEDPDMYYFWNALTVAGKTRTMLCFTAHYDSLDPSIVTHVNDHGELEVSFEMP